VIEHYMYVRMRPG